MADQAKAVSLKDLTDKPFTEAVEYAKGLTTGAMLQYGAAIARDMREHASAEVSRAGLLVILVQGCDSLAAYDHLMKESEKAMRAHMGDNETGGQAKRSLDRTWIQYKSNLRAAFTYGVLPSKVPLAETDIRQKTKAARDNAKAKDRADMANRVASQMFHDLTPEQVSETAKGLSADFAQWINGLPHALQITFWEKVRPIREEVQKDFDKMRKAINGTEEGTPAKAPSEAAQSAQPTARGKTRRTRAA